MFGAGSASIVQRQPLSKANRHPESVLDWKLEWAPQEFELVGACVDWYHTCVELRDEMITAVMHWGLHL